MKSKLKAGRPKLPAADAIASAWDRGIKDVNNLANIITQKIGPIMTKSKLKAGRPKLPATDKHKPLSLTVSPDVRRYLTQIGGGSPGRGARLVAIRAAELAEQGKSIFFE